MNPPEVSGVAEAAPAVPPAAPQDGPRAARRKPTSANGPESYEAAFPELHRVAYRAAYRVTQHSQRAEDVAQEAMVRVYMRWARLETPEHRTAFVARAATNLAIDAHRRLATAARFAPVIARSDRSESRAGEARAELATVLAQLPKRQREVIMLRVVADQSEADTAAVLGCSLSAVRHHLNAGLTTLRTLHVADLIGPPSDDDVPGASVAAAVRTGEQRRNTQRKTRGIIAGIVAFVVAALGSGLFGAGVVQFRPNEANDKRTPSTTTTTTTTLAPGTPTTVVIGTDGKPVSVPVGPSGSATPVPGAPGGGGSGPTAPSGKPTTPDAGAGAIGAFPSASTTGVPAGVSLQPVGGLTIRTAGTVIEGRQINGCVSIEAPNVTIRNSRIAGNCAYIVIAGDTASGALLDRVEISGMRADPNTSTCVLGGAMVLRGVYVHDCLNGVFAGDGVRVEQSYVSGRYKGVYCPGCRDLTIAGSNVEAFGDGGALSVDDTAPLGALTVTGSRLNGGGFILWGGYSQTNRRNAPSPLTVTGNVFGPDYRYGTHANVGPNVVWANNTLESSGAPVTL